LARNHGADIAYRTRPYVCGAIGRWDPATLDRLRRGSPSGLRTAHTSAEAVLLTTRKPAPWQSGARHGYFWGDLAAGSVPVGWQTAAEGRLAAGLEIGDAYAILHTDALGLHDLFVRRVGDALYFAVRIDPLLDLTDDRLHTDWAAWASIAAVTCPLGDATPFQEVRRLIAATAWRARSDGLDQLSMEPRWMGVEPNGTVSPADAADVVAEHVDAARRATSITLSGGWDSRLLAILARRRRTSMVAWTTSNDDGRDRDIEYARMVAGALGLRHRVFLPGPNAWVDEHSAVRQRLNFQTNHHIWIMPLARVLHRQGDQFLDGLCGDVLFKSLFVGRDVVEAPTPELRRRVGWSALEQRRLQHRRLFAAGVARSFEELSRDSFDRAVSKFDDHPAGRTLAVLHTRTARAIASSAQWLLAPEASVGLPFIHPDVISTALAVPLTAKVGGGFYREMLHAANPVVAKLPSTNDAVKPRGDRSERRQGNAHALAAMAASVLADEGALRILAPELRLAMRNPDALAIVGQSTAALRMLHFVSLLGEWRSRYASRLADSGFEPG
jgi:Asparagine synthase